MLGGKGRGEFWSEMLILVVKIHFEVLHWRAAISLRFTLLNSGIRELRCLTPNCWTRTADTELLDTELLRTADEYGG
jgi:hypothetical protein